MHAPLTICYFGTYRPDYSRNRVLINGLRLNGVQVLECQSRASGSLRKRELLQKHRAYAGKYQVMVVGFPGHAVMPLAHRIARRQKVPLVFDAFTSQYGALAEGRGRAKIWNAKAWKSFAMDWMSCRKATRVLLDTQAHIKYLQQLVNLPADRFRSIFVGSDIDEQPPSPIPPKPAGKFIVHFHGHYSKFQGADVIVRAAKLLEHRPMVFRLIGRGQEYPAVSALAQKLAVTNVEFLPDVDYPTLKGYIIQSDLCLGVFGGGRPRPVIPNKIFEALALGRPVLTAHLPAMDELLQPNVHVAYCQAGDPQDLADKILHLEVDAVLRRQLGAAGRALHRQRLTPQILGAEMKEILEQLIAVRS
ncbi:MAG: glycosyltransferase [Patescibacteria group bacterium]|nr:glycosyltransferase [Patescibacteria group bacterium]